MSKETMEQEKHPIISVYGNTESKNFPIILVVGREPNSAAKFVNTIGEYDFEEYPRCSFWNISYSTIGEIINENWNCGDLKKIFKEKGSSFIAYTDLSPEPIVDSVSPNEKRIDRQARKLEEYKKHISNILAHKDIIERVDLIIFSGLGKNNVSIDALNVFKDEADNIKKTYIEIPFFYGSNKDKINAKINNDYNKEKEIIREIYNQWKDSI